MGSAEDGVNWEGTGCKVSPVCLIGTTSSGLKQKEQKRSKVFKVITNQASSRNS